MTSTTLLVLIPLCALVAAAYAAVGLGGGTGYLALMTLFGVATEAMPSTALMLNIVVTGAALLRFGIAGRVAPVSEQAVDRRRVREFGGCPEATVFTVEILREHLAHSLERFVVEHLVGTGRRRLELRRAPTRTSRARGPANPGSMLPRHGSCHRPS